jgi:peptidoglycan/LPS O-acetylase OafA/YrhL
MAVILPASSSLKDKPVVSRLLSYQELDILHALRGFCAFYVVVFHAKFVLWSGGTEYLRAFPRASWSPLQYIAFIGDILSSAGYEMVIFFFVLSGFFIRYAQLKKHCSALRFYLNRIVRIYPPYLASLVLGGMVLAYVASVHPALMTNATGRELNTGLLGAWHELHPLTLQGVGRAILFLKPGEHFFGYNGACWSLLPEALFYLAVPLAFWRIKFYYALSAAFYAYGIMASMLHLDTGFFGAFLFLFNGYFALGVGLYDVVTTRPNWLPAFRRFSGFWLALGIAALLLLLIGIAALHLRLLSGPVASVLAVLSVSVLLAGRVSRRNLLVRAFHEVGIFSFSLYLYHFPLLILGYVGIVALTGELVNYTRYYWVMLPLVTAGCFALYYVTERAAVRFFRGT